MGESLRVAQDQVKKVGQTERDGRQKEIPLLGRRFSQINADKNLLGQ
jgi:hypothetical protein